MELHGAARQIRLPEEKHVLILHEKLTKRRSDHYIINIALALHQIGYTVTLYTSQFDRSDCIDDLSFLDKIRIRYSAWWIPRSIFGLFRKNMSSIKAIWMATRLILFPPKGPKPKVILLDVGMWALYLLNTFTSYRICFVESFISIKTADACYEHSRLTPSLLEAKSIKLADEVIVETIGFAEILKKSYPSLQRSPRVLYPSVDIGLWREPGIKIQRIIPDLMENTITFLTIGKFRRSSNFKLSLDSFELLLELLGDKAVTQRFHLVIAGNCKTFEERYYYNQLLIESKERPCASQITFLNQLPIIHEKTLITEASIMIHPAKNDVYSDFILRAMSQGKPIVATNRGIASKLLTHRLSGAIVEADPKVFAVAMKKLILSPHLQIFLGDMARDTFEKFYSFDALCENVRGMMYVYKNRDRTESTAKFEVINNVGNTDEPSSTTTIN